MSQFSGSVTLDVELDRIGDVVAQRLLAAVADAGLVEQASRQVAAHLAVPPALYDRASVTCLGGWDAGQPGWYAFEFHAVALGTRFVLYAQTPDQYVAGVGYTLALSLVPASEGNQPARATAPVPEPAAPDRDCEPADVSHDQVSWFGGDGDQ